MTTTDPTTKPEVLFTESPASWNSRYVTPEGFVCQITIRGENGRDLLEKADIALKYLIEHGYTPEPYQRRNGKGDPHGQGKQCLIHGSPMKRFEKDGKTWYSHKTDDGWCYGREKKKGD